MNGSWFTVQCTFRFKKLISYQSRTFSHGYLHALWYFKIEQTWPIWYFYYCRTTAVCCIVWLVGMSPLECGLVLRVHPMTPTQTNLSPRLMSRTHLVQMENSIHPSLSLVSFIVSMKVVYWFRDNNLFCLCICQEFLQAPVVLLFIGSNVQVPSEVILLNAMVLPDKSLAGSCKNQIIL